MEDNYKKRCGDCKHFKKSENGAPAVYETADDTVMVYPGWCWAPKCMGIVWQNTVICDQFEV